MLRTLRCREMPDMHLGASTAGRPAHDRHVRRSERRTLGCLSPVGRRYRSRPFTLPAMEPTPLSFSLIVAATDFSEGAGHAVRRAAALAERTGAALHLVYVESPMGGDYPSEHADKSPVEAVRAWGDDAIGEAIHPARVEHVEAFALRDLAPADAILRHVAKTKADLLVTGTHGRRGLRRFLLGSVAEELVRLSPAPVLTVPYHCTTWPNAEHAVLAPVDFSDHAREALAWARQLAAHYDAPLHLLHVVQEAGPYPKFYPFLESPPLGSLHNLDPNIDAKARIELERFYAESHGPRVDVRFHVRSGTPSAEIVSFVRGRATGAVVMGTHGLHGLQHLLLGSTTEKTLRQLPCPAFTIRPRVVTDPATGRDLSRSDLVAASEIYSSGSTT